MTLNRFVKNELLAKHTNFRIGGPAKYFFEAKSSDEITGAVKWANEYGEPFFILGGGSNVLVSDEGFNGLVIKAANRGFIIAGGQGELGDRYKDCFVGPISSRPSRNDKTVIFAEAGILSAFLARKTAEAGLTGFEWAVSLPGTIGGAIRGNAGCFGGETKDVTKRVRVLRIKNQPFDKARGRELRIKDLTNHECNFNYRDSIFKHEDPPLIILSAELELQKDDPQKCLERVRKNLAKRKDKQPLEAASAGCIFKNFRFQISDFKFNFDIPPEFIKTGVIGAGWLVEQVGLLGFKIGGAEVSTKHGNFILNRGEASAHNVVDLIQKIKDAVCQKFNIEIEEEIQYVGF